MARAAASAAGGSGGPRVERKGEVEENVRVRGRVYFGLAVRWRREVVRGRRRRGGIVGEYWYQVEEVVTRCKSRYARGVWAFIRGTVQYMSY